MPAGRYKRAVPKRKPPTPKVTPKPPTPTIQEERKLQKRKKAKPVEEPYELLPERLAFGLQGRPTTGVPIRPTLQELEQRWLAATAGVQAAPPLYSGGPYVPPGGPGWEEQWQASWGGTPTPGGGPIGGQLPAGTGIPKKLQDVLGARWSWQAIGYGHRPTMLTTDQARHFPIHIYGYTNPEDFLEDMYYAETSPGVWQRLDAYTGPMPGATGGGGGGGVRYRGGGGVAAKQAFSLGLVNWRIGL